MVRKRMRHLAPASSALAIAVVGALMVFGMGCTPKEDATAGGGTPPSPSPNEPAAEPAPAEPADDAAAPADADMPAEISAEDWINIDTPQKLADLKGSPVLVEFWATWCGPCKQTIPHLNQVFEEHGPQGLKIVSLTREDRATVEKFMETTEMKYPIGVGSESADDYGVTGIPHAVLIGKDGTVVWEGHPAEPAMEEQIKAVL